MNDDVSFLIIVIDSNMTESGVYMLVKWKKKIFGWWSTETKWITYHMNYFKLTYNTRIAYVFMAIALFRWRFEELWEFYTELYQIWI